MSTPPTDRTWTATDVAAFFQVSDRLVREWRRTDLTFPLPLALPGRTVRWDPAAVMAWAKAEVAA